MKISKIKFLFCYIYIYIYKLHNLYFVIFVYFGSFVYFVSFCLRWGFEPNDEQIIGNGLKIKLTCVGVISNRKLGPRNCHSMTNGTSKRRTRSADEKLIKPVWFHVFYHRPPRRRTAKTKDKRDVNASNTIKFDISDIFDRSAISRRSKKHCK